MSIIAKVRKFEFHILTLPRTTKIFIVVLIDSLSCSLSVWLAFYLRLGEPVILMDSALIGLVVANFLALPIFFLSGQYRAIFRYNGWSTLYSLAVAIAIYGALYATTFTVIGFEEFPRTIGIIQPLLLLLFVGSTRALAQLWLGNHFQSVASQRKLPKVLIYGAGSAGRQLAAALSKSHQIQAVGFIDDDKRLHNHLLNGLPIYKPSKLPILVKKHSINHVLLAIPSACRKRRNEIIGKIHEAQVSVRTLPSFVDLVNGKITVSHLHELDIDDLLGREPVLADQKLLEKHITGQVILVTGAGGSIGSELCRQILACHPKKLLMIDQNEYGLYAINQELESKKTKTILVPLLASIQDSFRMNEIMSNWHPQSVYHAAAYKHVPIVENNIAEGVKNNVLGTLSAAKAATANGVKNFVLISTDKAVRPTNIMGASKRLAEMVVQALASKNSPTSFSIVRFGNVLDSSGSVVPKFRHQIKEGGPVTVTHPEITRYFMTIPEASQLVIQAGAMTRSGDVFVLDMGEPVKIKNLAERMIELSGLSVKNEKNLDGDIEIEITKLRPGEKLYEELLIGNNPESTSHPRIMKARESFLEWTKLEEEIKTLTVALNANNVQLVRQLLRQLVTEYQPHKNIVDLIYLENNQTESIS